MESDRKKVKVLLVVHSAFGWKTKFQHDKKNLFVNSKCILDLRQGIRAYYSCYTKNLTPII